MDPQTAATGNVSFGPVVIIALMFTVLGIVIGHRIGLELGKKADNNKQYWTLNLAVFVVGILLAAISALFPLFVSGLVLGLIGGAIAGLKHGYGKSVGIWKAHDKAFLVSEAKNKDKFKNVKTAGEKRDDENNERELMSVSPNAAKTYPKNKKK